MALLDLREILAENAKAALIIAVTLVTMQFTFSYVRFFPISLFLISVHPLLYVEESEGARERELAHVW